jgi:phosphohistidine phosphatase
MHMLAVDLAGSGDPARLTALAHKFPTGALAAIRFKVRAWSHVGPGKGSLEVFMAPRILS